MVRIQRRVSRKRYLNSKRVYEYERVSLHVSRRYHELIKPFLKQDFGVSVAAEKGMIVITLTPQSGPATVSINKLYKHQEKDFFTPCKGSVGRKLDRNILREVVVLRTLRVNYFCCKGDRLKT